VKFAGSLIVVEDVPRSRAFYEGVLGLEVLMDLGLNVAYRGFSIQQRALWEKVLGGVKVSFKPRDMEFYFEDDGVEAWERKLTAAGVEIVHGVMEQPWRQRVLRFYDPDGHLVEIGETMGYVARRLMAGGMTLEEVAAVTSMPAEALERELAASGRNGTDA
jgi:catechol 2,3-dioxygenase-like lactoylglutathione lyase family enzyme